MKNKMQAEILSFSMFANSADQHAATNEQKGFSLAKKIEDAMKAKGYSRQHFAHAMSVQPSIITRWLTGRHNFTVETLYDIENVLGVRLLDIETPTNHFINLHMTVDSEHAHFTDTPLITGIASLWNGHHGGSGDSLNELEAFYLNHTQNKIGSTDAGTAG